MSVAKFKLMKDMPIDDVIAMICEDGSVWTEVISAALSSSERAQNAEKQVRLLKDALSESVTNFAQVEAILRHQHPQAADEVRSYRHEVLETLNKTRESRQVPEAVKRGLEQAERGELKDLRSFAPTAQDYQKSVGMCCEHCTCSCTACSECGESATQERKPSE